jgi:hypothetical protein
MKKIPKYNDPHSNYERLKDQLYDSNTLSEISQFSIAYDYIKKQQHINILCQKVPTFVSR